MGRPTKDAEQRRKPRPADREGFAERLKGLRDSRGESQTAFAVTCGITSTRSRDYVDGKHQPGFDQLFRIADQTGVSLDWLLFGDGDSGPVFRGQTRTVGGLADDVAAHVRRELTAGGVSAHDVERYLPSSAELLARLVGAGREAVRAGRAAAVGRYRAAIARLVTGRGLPDEVRALAFLFADAADDASVRLQPLEWGGGMLAAAELLPLVPPGDLCAVELVTARAELDKGRHNFELSTARPSPVPYRMSATEEAATPPGVARRYRASTDAHQAAELRQLEEELSRAYRLDRLVRWSAGHRWDAAPDPMHPDFIRWRWVGPLDSSAPRATE